MPFKPKDPEPEYAKDPNLKREDVLMLRQWLQKQPHLPEINDFQTILFLQSCYYRIEATKTTIDNYFTIRSLCPDILTPILNIEDLKRNLSVGAISVLPQKTPEGYVVVIMRLKDTNPDHYVFAEQVKLLDMVMTLFLHQNGTCNGLVTVADMRGLSFMHLTKMGLTHLKKFLYYVQEAIPVRIKGAHHINVVSFVDKLMAMVKPFLKAEILQVTLFHSQTIQTLYKYVPQEIFPEDYGGGGPTLAALDAETEHNLLNNMDFFEWVAGQKVDESKRPGKPKNAGNTFGAQGTFKKLEID